MTLPLSGLLFGTDVDTRTGSEGEKTHVHRLPTLWRFYICFKERNQSTRGTRTGGHTKAFTPPAQLLVRRPPSGGVPIAPEAGFTVLCSAWPSRFCRPRGLGMTE